MNIQKTKELFQKFLNKCLFLIASKVSLYEISLFILKLKWKFYFNMNESIYEDDRVRLRYFAGGAKFGDTLILVHGFGSGGMHQTKMQLNEYAKKYRILVPDLVYFGESTSKVDEYSLEFQVESIMKIIKFLKIDTFTIIGNSYGGMVAIILAEQCKEQLKKLVIIDSPIKYYNIEIANKAAQKLGVPSIYDLLIPKKPKDIQALFDLVHAKPQAPLPNFILQDLYRSVFNIFPKEKTKLLDYLKDNENSLNKRNWNFKIPILLVWGEQDQLVPIEIAHKIHKYFKKHTDTHLEIIPNAAHAPHIEKPRTFNHILTNFLEKTN